MDIGILGGTFDPVHLGHIAVAEEARRRLALRQILFVPAGQPWLKTSRETTPAVHRGKMLKLAIKGISYFTISTVEIDRPGPSYTVDTLAALQTQLGTKVWLFLLMGWDSFNELSEWHHPNELVKMCQLVAFTRMSSERPDLDALEKFVPGIKKNTILLDIKAVDISSTDIRERAAKGLSLEGLVPETVERYIREQKLYS
jgi:nicotinate-nucleotide adenylyltransferase